MVSVMRVDVAPLKHFIILGALASLIIIIGIIVGAAGMLSFFKCINIKDYNSIISILIKKKKNKSSRKRC